MAEEEKKEEQKAPEKEAGGKTGLLAWIIITVVVSLLSGSGFFLGRLLAGSGLASPKEGETASEEVDAANEESLEAGENWFYDLEPVVSNLDGAGLTRYVRASITMEISGELKEVDSEALFKAKNPILRNWLAVYLASLSVEEARGDKNLKRIQLVILDSFNETLFPDSKPLIKQILFKEFAIQ